MKLFLQVLLLSTSVFLATSCVSTKHFVKDKVEATSFTVLPLLEGDYSTTLYKAKIDLGEKHYSGLFYFKALPDTSYRIVFLSEFGLNLLDLEYKNHEFTVKNCKDFLNKKVIINTLKKDLRLLIDTPYQSKKKLYKSLDNKEVLAKFKKCSKREYYFYSEEKKLDKIIRTKGLSHIEVLAEYGEKEIPQKMTIKNKRINLDIKFNLLKLD